jgi:hypothetical protein
MEDDFSIHFPPPPRDPTGGGGGGEGDCDSVGERGEEPALFGVFDGHGGARVSQYASKHLLGMYPPPHMILCMSPPPHMTCMYPCLSRSISKAKKNLKSQCASTFVP